MYPSAIIYFIHFNINKLKFIFYIKGVFHFEEPSRFSICSDEDLVFLGQASMGIKKKIKEKKYILYM
jgi:hypothetical protein